MKRALILTPQWRAPLAAARIAFHEHFAWDDATQAAYRGLPSGDKSFFEASSWYEGSYYAPLHDAIVGTSAAQEMWDVKEGSPVAYEVERSLDNRDRGAEEAHEFLRVGELEEAFEARQGATSLLHAAGLMRDTAAMQRVVRIANQYAKDRDIDEPLDIVIEGGAQHAWSSVALAQKFGADMVEVSVLSQIQDMSRNTASYHHYLAHPELRSRDIGRREVVSKWLRESLHSLYANLSPQEAHARIYNRTAASVDAMPADDQLGLLVKIHQRRK